jgi:hypothetical protein
VGAFLLWVGWFGFNAGSAVGASTRAGMAMLCTHISAGDIVVCYVLQCGVGRDSDDDDDDDDCFSLSSSLIYVSSCGSIVVVTN